MDGRLSNTRDPAFTCQRLVPLISASVLAPYHGITPGFTWLQPKIAPNQVNQSLNEVEVCDVQFSGRHFSKSLIKRMRRKPASYRASD